MKAGMEVADELLHFHITQIEVPLRPSCEDTVATGISPAKIAVA